MKIICIGRNYADHAKELNNQLPENPVFFTKPDTCLLRNNQAFYLPDFSKDIHYEIELVVKINRIGKNISAKFASRYYEEIGLGIDFTARDLQQKCKEKGLPWEISKAFDHSAPVSQFIAKSEFENIDDVNFHLEVNGEEKQRASSADMIFKIDEIISYISQFFTLKIGDLIYTGTPAGVGPVKIDDHLTGYLEGRKLLDFKVK